MGQSQIEFMMVSTFWREKKVPFTDSHRLGSLSNHNTDRRTRGRFTHTTHQTHTTFNHASCGMHQECTTVA